MSRPISEKFIKRRIASVIWLILGIIFLSALFLHIFFSNNKKNQAISSGKPYSIIKGHVFSLEIAETSEKQNRGLGGREDICSNCAMLFLFPDKQTRAFTVKDMKFSLDIVWISESRIVAIEKNISPAQEESIIQDIPIDKVIEMKGGTCEKYGIEKGDRIILKNITGSI